MDGLLEDLFEAYFKARKNKRNKRDQLAFEQNFESSLITLYEQIIQREFEPQSYTAFISQKTVIREVFAPSFRDRVVHHLLYKYLSEIYEPHFIDDSFSCRVGKGTLYGIYRLKDMIYQCSKGYTEDCYVLKLDISRYFYNIDKNILYDKCVCKMKKYFLNDDYKYDTVDYLLKKILFDDVVSDAKKIGSSRSWRLLKKNRSLFYTPKNRGLPIGNLTSQLFSNIYMDEFDHFIKDDLDIKHYGRYVDDFVVVHQDKEFLKKLMRTSSIYLKHHLGLELHPNKIYLQHYSKGVQFLGAFVKPYRVYIGNRVKGNFGKLIKEINKLFEEKCLDIAEDRLLDTRATLNSYLGLLSKFNTYKLRVKYLSKLNECFYKYFYIDANLRRITLCKK